MLRSFIFFFTFTFSVLGGACPDLTGDSIKDADRIEDFIKVVRRLHSGAEMNETIEKCFYGYEYPLPIELFEQLKAGLVDFVSRDQFYTEEFNAFLSDEVWPNYHELRSDQRLRKLVRNKAQSSRIYLMGEFSLKIHLLGWFSHTFIAKMLPLPPTPSLIFWKIYVQKTKIKLSGKFSFSDYSSRAQVSVGKSSFFSPIDLMMTDLTP